MKRYVIAAGICIAAGIILNVNLQYNKAELNTIKITIASVEALANDEHPTPSCSGLGSLDCPTSTIKVRYIISR